MPYILLPSKRTFQPNAIVPALNNNIASNLISLAYPGSNRDVVRKKQVTLSGNAKMSCNSSGLAWQGDTTNSPINIGATGGIDSILDQTKPWSLATRVEILYLSQDAYFISDANLLTTAFGFGLGVTHLNSWYLYCIDSTTALSIYLPGSLTLGVHDILAVFSGGTVFNAKLYVDGILLGQTANSVGTQKRSGSVLRLLNLGLRVEDNAFSGKMSYVAFFQEDMSSYARRLAENPWQLLKPIES